ncbi:12214_t:CDS:10, partial [Racocetra fulgida]
SGSSNVTRQSLITLPEVSDADLSVSSISGFSGGFDAGFEMNDDLLMMDDSGIDFDEEGGLHEFELRSDGQNETQRQNGHDPLNPDMNEIMKRVREEHDAGLQGNQKEKRRIRQKEPAPEGQEDEQIADVQMDIEREDTEMTNEQIIAMRDGVVNDLEEGERIAKDKAKMQEYKGLWKQALYTPGLPRKAQQLSTFWSAHCAPMLQDDIVKQRRAQPVFIPQHDFNDLYADVEDIGIGGSRQHERDSSLQDIELERLRKAGSQSNSAITGLNSTGTEVPDLLGKSNFDGASSVENLSRDILEFSGQLGR